MGNTPVVGGIEFPEVGAGGCLHPHKPLPEKNLVSCRTSSRVVALGCSDRLDASFEYLENEHCLHLSQFLKASRGMTLSGEPGWFLSSLGPNSLSVRTAA